MTRLPTGTVTFLFTDIENSTRLWEEHPDLVKPALIEHDRILRSAIEENDGYVFATGGDSFSAAFERPADALIAAISAQIDLADLDDGDAPLRVRMAVYTGEADEREGDYFGSALNRTARLLSVGNGRQILLSSTTVDLVQGELPDGASLVDLGRHRLKDLFRPEHVFRLCHSSMPDDSRDLRSLDFFPQNLPSETTSFVGRENEVAEIEKLIAGSRMVTLTGVGGAGKTRLALQSAAELLPKFDDGVWLIELGPVSDPGRVVSAVLEVLRVEERPTELPLDTLVGRLRDKELLLVLDNCEHLIDASCELASRILASAPNVSILATSRERLGIAGEYALQVRSLGSPVDSDLDTSTMMRYPAVRLFVERGEVASPGWRLTPKHGAAVVQICRRLDGIPLAIELAAARLAMMTTKDIVEHLDDRFRLLTGGSRAALPRQQTLEAAIEWSYDLLSDDEAILFARLAVFMGGFALDAAKTVCGDDPLDDLSVVENLGHLVDKSLVQVQDSGDGMRYTMLETLRTYARGQLARTQEIESVRRRHAGYYLGLAEEAESNVRGEDEDFWIERLDRELDNLRQAFNWAIESEPRIAQRLIGSLYLYLMDSFRSSEARDWAVRAVEASNETTVAGAKALLAAGTSTIWSAEIASGLEYLDQAVSTAKELDIAEVHVRGLNNKTTALALLGNWSEADELRLRALELARRHNVSPVHILNNMSVSALGQQDFEMAVSWAREAIQAAEQLGSDRRLNRVKLNLVSALIAHEDLDDAEELLDDIRTDEQNLGASIPGASQLERSTIAMRRGELNAAREQLSEAVEHLGEATNPNWEVAEETLWRGADLLSRLGKPDLGALFLGSSDGVNESRGSVRYPYEAELVSEVRAAIQGALTTERFRQLYEQGGRMELREAIRLLGATLGELTE